MARPIPGYRYVEASLRVRSTADGGRAHPIFPGYRGGWRIPQPSGERIYTDAAVYPVDTEALAPGESGNVLIYPLREETGQAVRRGAEIDMCEGERIVGVATIDTALTDHTSVDRQPAAAAPRQR